MFWLPIVLDRQNCLHPPFQANISSYNMHLDSVETHKFWRLRKTCEIHPPPHKLLQLNPFTHLYDLIVCRNNFIRKIAVSK